MTSLAVATPSTARRIGLLDIDRHHFSADLEEPEVKLAPARVAQSRFEYDRGFQHGCRGNPPDGWNEPLKQCADPDALQRIEKTIGDENG